MLVTLATLSVTISSPVEEKVKVILATTGTMHENSFIAHSLNYWQEAPFLLRNNYLSNRIPSSETQGQIVGVRESLNRWKNMAQKKSEERPEEPLETMSYHWCQSETRTAATVWNWSGEALSPGALLAVLHFSFVPYFSACLDFPSPPLSAPGSPRMTESLKARLKKS